MPVATSPSPTATTRAPSPPAARRARPPAGATPEPPLRCSGRLRQEAPALRRPTDRAAPTRPSGGPVVVDLATGPEVRSTVRASAGLMQADSDPAPAQARLPLGRLAGLAGSGAFAFWTSLTCFVC